MNPAFKGLMRENLLNSAW